MLQNLLEKHFYRRVFTGWSGAEAYYLPDLAAYLKIAPLESLSDLGARERSFRMARGKTAGSESAGI